METRLKKKTAWIYLPGIAVVFTGCAPGPPPPPIFPGFDWLVIGTVFLIWIFLWKKYASAAPSKTHYLTDMLNAINQRLKVLEDKIKKLEEKANKKRE